jgi:O-antigen/teichoic acid export membrane protein
MKIHNQIKKYSHHMKNIFWSNTSQAIITVASLVSSVMFARLATKDLYGQYLLIMSILNLFSLISISGVRTVIFLYTAKKMDGIFAKGTWFSFLWSLWGVPAIMITGIFFFIFKSPAIGASIILLSLFFPLVMSFGTWEYYLKGKSEFKKNAMFNFAKLSVQLITLLLAIILTKQLFYIILAYLVVNSVFNIMFYISCLKTVQNNLVDNKWKRQSYSLNLLDFSSQIFGQVDILIIGILMPINQVAIYGLSMRIVDVIYKVIKSTLDAIRPKIYHDKKITLPFFYKAIMLSVLVPIILYPIIKYPVILLYGSKYNDVIFYTQIYLFSIPIYFLSIVSQDFLIKYQMNKAINITKIISIIVVIASYAILIPAFGLLGGVVASAGYFLVQAVANMIALRIHNQKLHSGDKYG